MLSFNCIAKIYDMFDICKYFTVFFLIFFMSIPGTGTPSCTRNTSYLLTVHPAYQNKNPAVPAGATGRVIISIC